MTPTPGRVTPRIDYVATWIHIDGDEDLKCQRDQESVERLPPGGRERRARDCHLSSDDRGRAVATHARHPRTTPVETINLLVSQDG